MIIAGKCPPEEKKLEAARERGFEKVELYLEREHLDQFEETLDNVRESPVDVVSVHTPHVSLEEKDYFLKADRLASRLDAFLVFHSQHLHHSHIPEIEQFNFPQLSLENNPGASKRHLESMILERDHELVLDTAHLFMAEESYLQTFNELLDSYGERIPVIHLCDSTLTEDGLPFGKGQMDMKAISQTIQKKFDGLVVLEVMPEDQEYALEKWRQYTS